MTTDQSQLLSAGALLLAFAVVFYFTRSHKVPSNQKGQMTQREIDHKTIGED